MWRYQLLCGTQRALTFDMGMSQEKEEGGRPYKLSNKRPPCPPLLPLLGNKEEEGRKEEGRKEGRGTADGHHVIMLRH